jgi:hypothetical protein
MYFGLWACFISWQSNVEEAVRRCASKRRVTVEDRDWSEDELVWDVSDRKRDFGLKFDPRDKIKERIDYYRQLRC